jgi:VCBS repeat-containing protein
LAAILVTEPLFGSLTLNPDGSFEYNPVVNFTGNDSFSYKVTDGNADSNVAMVTIAVNLPTVTTVSSATTPTTVSVSRFGSGAGSVLSNPLGIDCGNDCVEPYPRGTIVTLVAHPAEGSVFVGWIGAGCAGTGLCIFNVETDLSITAIFDSISPESTPAPSDPPPAPPPSPPLTLTGLFANISSPQVVGTSVTFSAAAAGGNTPLQFKWSVHDGTDWRVQQDWNTDNTFVFAPTQAAPYLIALWGRSAGNNSDAPENDAVLTLAFTFAPVSCPAGQYLAEFYNNMNLNGGPALVACHDAVDFNWAASGPGSGIGSDNFSVRWTGRFPFSAGIYNFVATADDGIRAWIDGNLIIDGWIDQAATTYQAALDLSEGEHVVKIEYYQNGGDALTQFYWQRVVTGANDYYVMFENNSLTVDAPGVLGNDNDISGNSLSATLVSGTSNGVLILNPDGSFSYTPNPNFNGTDSFTYRADNGSATSNVATVTISVTAVNDVPVASNDSYVVLEDNSLVVDAPGVLGNDNDLDGNLLTAVLLSTTTNGVLNFNSDGSFSYTPNPNFNGTDTFTYLANDGTSDGNVAMVTITVTEFNDIPIAANDSYETNNGSALSVIAPGVLDNDVDPESNPLGAILVTEPLFGSLTLNPDGSFEYNPVVNFTGTDSFTYKVTDGNADSNVAMVTITVNPATGL